MEMILQRNERVAFRIIGQETIIVLHDEKFVYQDAALVLNNTATAIWRLIDGKNTAVDIAKKIVSEYDVEYTEAINTIKAFLGELKKHNLIKAK